MIYLVVLICVFWSMLSLAELTSIWSVKPLPKRDKLPSADDAQPNVTVVITARDEQQHIETTVRGILAQEGIDLQVVAVDDRSADETGAILDRVAAEDARLDVVHVEELPEGWLGKCHACHQGSSRARGEWLLFTDADTTLASRDLIARTILTAKRDAADHLPLWPTLQCRGALARGTVLAWEATLSAYAPPILINHDIGPRALGVGAYNLVRASAYRDIGGHERLRLEVVDDVKMGVLLRGSGYRQRIYKAIGEMMTEWGGSASEVIRNTEKNWFAAVGYSTLVAFFFIVLMTVTWVLGVTGPLWEPRFGWWALGGVLSIIFPALLQTRVYHWPPHVALLAPIGNLVLVAAAMNSTFKTLRQGGIYWRETFYSLAELRQGRVR